MRWSRLRELDRSAVASGVVPALILAAGASLRMGSPKALLVAPDGVPFVVRIARTFRTAGVAEVVVVTGVDHDAVAHALEGEGVRCARNPDPSRGQLSSLLVGLDTVEQPDVEACLVTLVDVPMLRVETVHAVLTAWRRTWAPVVRPAIGSRHGHPVLFDRALFAELRQAPIDIGAKAVVHAHASEVWNEPVDDEGCLTDVDTPADYQRLTKL
jgi:molybdenum cofactor cytidylyltransferase